MVDCCLLGSAAAVDVGHWQIRLFQSWAEVVKKGLLFCHSEWL